MFDLRNLSFGGPAAIVTSMALMVGFAASSATRATIVSGLLIIALADNLTDTLSVHIYQESERLPARMALRTTIANFCVRLCTGLSFAALAAFLPLRLAVPSSLVWGFVLLAILSYLLARQRSVSPVSEIAKHCGAAAAVILASRIIGSWVAGLG